MIELRTFGTLVLRDQNGEDLRAVLAQPKRVALLAYLAIARPRGFHRRDTLLALLWPEQDEQHARGALNQALRHLRTALGKEAVPSRGDGEIGIDVRALSCDAAEFEAAIEADDPAQALRLYRGDLLEGFHVSGGGEFERWLEEERVWLRRRAARAAATLAHREEARGEPVAAGHWARRAFALAPDDEGEVRNLIELLGRLGDRAGAVQAYEEFARRLRIEYEVEPAPETLATINAVRIRQVTTTPLSAPAVDHLHRDVGLVAPESTVEVPPPGPPAPPPEPVLVPPSPGSLLPKSRRRRWVIPGIIGLLVVGALAAIGRTDRGSLDKNLMAVAPFDVFNPKLDLWREGLVDILSRDFDGAGTLRVVSPRVAIRDWNGRAEPAEAKALGRRTGAGLVVFGQLVESGPDSVRLTASLLDVEENRPLGEVDLRDASAHMDRLVDSTAVALLRALGRHRPMTSTRQAPLGGASLPALKEFLRGEQFYRRSAWDSALAHYDAATALDSTFALAYRRMRLSLTWSPPTAHSFQSPQAYAFRAAAFNRGLPARDSLLIMMDSLLWGGLGWDDTAYFSHRRRAFAALDQLARLNPNDPEVWHEIGEVRHHWGTPAEFTGEEKLAALERAIQLDPEYGPAYEHTVVFAIRLGRLELARQYAEAYLDFVPTDISSQQNRLDALLLDPALAASYQAARLIDTSAAGPLLQAVFDLSGWVDSAETALRLARSLASGTHSLAGAPPWLTDTFRTGILASVLAFRGHFQEARASVPSSPITEMFNPVLDLALLGAFPPDSVRTMVRALLAGDSLWPPSRLHYALPWWYADLDTAALKRFEIQAVAGARRYPNPVAKAYLLNVAEVGHAYLVLARGDSTEGLRMLAALPDSLCALRGCFFEKFTLATLAAARGQNREAAAIYDRWLGARDWSPLFVLGRLNRARIAERLGDRDRAADLYQYVVDAWRHADPELQSHVVAARHGLERVAAEPRE
jgi:DNA-binding SARP family transcriptional activator